MKLASGSLPAGCDPTGRLQFQGEIARGGMGAILKAHDTYLGRDIAVKVLLQEHQGNAELTQRFVEETQITGQLQHPGIVPVYELGRFQDQRPFFTMKLVKGKTLGALMAARQDPVQDRARLLGIFAQVCQALAYAHARGVIHRDLKPSNIMVGAFGEVQVMDWGLAKVLSEGGVADEKKVPQRPDVSVIRTQRSTGSESTDFSSYTQAGSILGTPSYLAPEQARGDVELIDERADVFGLGAILCELLTGQPPYTGRGAEATRKAQTGKLDEAWVRLDACGADVELVSLAKRCLAVEPWDRPRDAGAVAKEVAAYQNSVEQRLRQAAVAQAAEAARAEEALLTLAEAKAKAKAERQSRRLTLALAASVLLAAALGAFGLRRIELDRMSRFTALNARVNAALHEAMRQRGEAQAAAAGSTAPWAAAASAARQAEALLESGVDPALRQQVQTLLGEVATGAQRADDEARALDRDRQLLDRLVDIRSAKEDDPDGSATDSGYADAFREAGIDVAALSPAEIAARLKARPPAVALTVTPFLDDWAQLRRRLRDDAEGAVHVAQAAQALDPDPWRQKLRDAMAQPGTDRLATLQELAKTTQNEDLGPVTLDLLGQLLLDGGDAAAAEKVLRAAQQRHPDDVWVNHDLASALSRLRRREEAIRYYMAAHALRPETGHVLAHRLQDAGEPEEAIRIFRELTRLRPRDGYHLACLGSALRIRGRAQEAEAICDAAVTALREQIHLAPSVSKLHNSLGIAFTGKHQTDDAIAAYRRALELEPKSTVPRNNLCRTLRSKGLALQDKGQLDEAIAAYREVLDLDPNQVPAHDSLVAALKSQGRLAATIADYRQALAQDPQNKLARYGLPIALRANDQLDEAAAAYREAIELNPKVGWLHDNLGLVLRDKGLLDEAIAACRQSIEVAPSSGVSHANLGSLLSRKGLADEAIAAYRKAAELDPRSAVPQNLLGLALRAKGKPDEAIAAFRQAVELDPKSISAQDSLATNLRAQGKLDEAIAGYRQALQRDPQQPTARYGLAFALRAGGKLDEAIAAWRQAIDLDPQLPWVHYYLGLVLRDKGQMDEAIAAYRKSLELDPKSATVHNSLGLALRASGRPQEAALAYGKAVELAPNVASYHNNLGYSLFMSGQLDEAVAAYRKSLELDPKYETAHDNLVNALKGQGQLDAAIAAYRQTLELDSQNVAARFGLAVALRASSQSDEAIAAFRQAIVLDPKLSWLHHFLGLSLLDNGQLDEAIAAEKQALTLQPEYFACRRSLAGLLFKKEKYLEALTHFERAIAARPTEVNLFDAACCAALAAAGKDEPPQPLDDIQRARWRKRAIDWLRSDLDQRLKQLEKGNPADQAVALKALQAWQQDERLAPLREAQALQQLPPAEQEECRKLWAEVAVLLQKVPTSEQP